MLDFDFAKENGLNIKDIAAYLDESHAQTKAFFESVLTEGYFKYVTGEAI